MALYETELFGQIVYGPDLTYDDLLAREEALKAEIDVLLENFGGEHIHFESIGDAMRVQCVFAGHGEELFHRLCEDLAPHMDGAVEARLLLVHKDLATLHFYTISRGAWMESVLQPPHAGPLGRALAAERLKKKK